MKTKVASVILAIVLTISLAVPAFATNYSDLDGHWAKTYMEDLAGKGFLSGYDDGTMRPDNNITAAETLVLLSRLYTPDTEEMQWIYSDYESFLTEKIDVSYAWAYDEFSVCLAAGIVTESELSGLKLSGTISKELLSVFTVRAMQKEDTALSLSTVTLKFSDTQDITENNRGYVSVLVTAGIVTGNDDNNFLPNSKITRAVAATIVSRVLTYIKTSGLTLKIEAYEGLEKTEGIISSAGSNYIRLGTMEGPIREYTVTSAASIKVNGTAKTLSSVYTGCYALITTNDNVVTKVEITNDSSVTWVQGTLYSKYTYLSTSNIYLASLESGENTKYIIPSSAAIMQGGEEVAFSDLTTGYFVTLKLENGAVTALTSYAGTSEITGNISTLSYGTTITLKVTDSAGAIWYFAIDFSDLPKITRGETLLSIDRLSLGDKVVITAEIGQAATIAVEASEDTITGELISSTTTTSGTTWTIKDTSGESRTLAVDNTAGVYSGSSSILLSDISAGDTVTVTVYGNTITEINRDSSASSASKVTGTVLTVDATAKTITILVSGKLVYIDTSGTVFMLTASTGRTVKLSAITAESTLVAYGTYDNSTSFDAVTIIIES